MDKNSILGLILISGILGFFVFYNKPSEEVIQRQQQIRDSLMLIEKQRAANEALDEKQKEILDSKLDYVEKRNDTLSNKIFEKEYGEFSNAAVGDINYTTIENEKLIVKFSNKGGKIYSVELKEYKTYDGKPLVLFTGDSTIFGLGFPEMGKSTDQLFFETSFSEPYKKIGNDVETISYKLFNNDKSSYIEYVYSIPRDDYMLKFDVKFNNFASNNNYLNLKWDLFMPAMEKGRSWEEQNTTIHYKYWEDTDDYLSASTSGVLSEDMTGKVKWVAFKQQFFSSIVIADDAFLRGSRISLESIPNSVTHIKRADANLDMAFDKQNIGMRFYFGPNHYSTLKEYNESLERIIPLGWGIFGWVNRFAVIPIFDFLSKYFVNYGLIILLLTIIIKVVLFPLTYKSYLSTAKMRVLKPEVEELGKKYPKKEDAMQKQQATMALYRKVGVNPLGGCLPMLIQMPILIAMFRFFPASIELRQKSFLWAEDLSTYDSILSLPFEIPFYGDHVSLFTLLMAGSMILTTMASSSNMTTMPGQPNMKVMMWMMPIMMLFWFNSYSSGLSYYYFIANMITYSQTWIIGRSIDDVALLKKLKEHKPKIKKKSNFQLRLEEMQKRQRDIQKRK